MVQEIENYIQSIIESNACIIEMSDTPLGSGGARCVAGLLNFCSSLTEINLSQCDIKDAGAKCLFEDLKDNKTVQYLNLSGN
jgi:Ran GTPase-activating protein (RanGAP) involved in mRNA processing and transport